MKLYVSDPLGNKKYLDVTATSRGELVRKLGRTSFKLDEGIYSVSQVMAENSGENTPLSMVVGGALGLFGGVPGVIAGGILGGLIGNDADKKEKALVEAFNRSQEWDR